ncbi:hypothetical protein niasHT_036343 [Heterodera trifolii]|uniref:Uncharacterized protein n=1 Tax=Heterodera trifolii TaxID=157864 RepID=A0ABD2IW82_9BILA
MANEKQQQQTAVTNPKQSSASSSSASSSSSTAQPGEGQTEANSAPASSAPRRPPDPPKIPPPPTEHPPPYTPFGGQSASLIPSTAQNGEGGTAAQSRANRNRVIQAPGWRKYGRHLTLRNILIGAGVLIGLIIFCFFVHWANKSDDAMRRGREPLDGTHKTLRWTHKGMGKVNGKRDRISFDKAERAVILSEFDMDTKLLQAEYVRLDDHLAGFAPHIAFNATSNWPDKFDDCMRFSKKLVCCSTPSTSDQHQTKCFLRDEGRQFVAVASMFDFWPRWQSLADGAMLLVVQNRQHQAVLDLKRNILLPIEEHRLPHGYISQGFYFYTETADGLAELVRVGETLRICEYIRTRLGDADHGSYVLKDRPAHCRQMPFPVDVELSRRLFCANTLYTAVLQFGHMPGGQGVLHWHFRLQFDSSPTLYSAHDELAEAHSVDQMEMNCGETNVDLFALNDHELHLFQVHLPTDERNEHIGGH